MNFLISVRPNLPTLFPLMLWRILINLSCGTGSHLHPLLVDVSFPSGYLECWLFLRIPFTTEIKQNLGQTVKPHLESGSLFFPEH